MYVYACLVSHERFLSWHAVKTSIIYCLTHFHSSQIIWDLRRTFIFSEQQLQHVSTYKRQQNIYAYATYYDPVFRLGFSYCMSICVENGHLFRHHRHSINIHTKWSFSLPLSLLSLLVVVSIIWFCRLRCHLFRGFLLECSYTYRWLLCFVSTLIRRLLKRRKALLYVNTKSSYGFSVSSSLSSLSQSSFYSSNQLTMTWLPKREKVNMFRNEVREKVFHLFIPSTGSWV